MSWPVNATRVLYAGTVCGHSIHAHIHAAVNGGFNAITLFPRTYWQSLEAGQPPAELCTRVKERGLHIAAVEPLLDWVPGWPPHGARMLPRHLPAAPEAIRMAVELEARAVIVAWSRRRKLPIQQWVDAFGSLCHRAKQHNLEVWLEFLPWSGINDLGTAERIVTAAAQANGGLLLDCWHHHRSGGNENTLQACNARTIRAIQLSDARSRPGRWPILETLTRRRMPGKGVINLPAWLASLKKADCQASLGIEVFNCQLRKLAPQSIGHLAGQSLDKIIEQSQRVHARGRYA